MWSVLPEHKAAGVGKLQCLGRIVAMVGDDFHDAPTRNFQQNLSLAFVYNGLGIPIAAGAFYPIRSFTSCCGRFLHRPQRPASSISVALTALRLNVARLLEALVREKPDGLSVLSEQRDFYDD